MAPLFLLFVLLAAPGVPPPAPPSPAFELLEKGRTPSYSKEGPRRQDLSGAICVEGKAYLAYDGGPGSSHPEIRVAPLDRIQEPGKVLSRVVGQRDLEAITFFQGRFYVVSSQDQVDEDTEAFRLLTEFQLDPSGRFVRNERSVVIRDLLLDSLRTFPDEAWFTRVAATFGVRGGLNIEGLSFDPKDPETLLLGLRSPLWGPAFGDPTFGKTYGLDRGQAIVAWVSRPFSSRPLVKLEPLDLGGHGIRDIAFVPALDAYLVIGGPVDRGRRYSLWLWSRGQAPRRLQVPAFELLCRPEALMPVPGKREVYIFSEEGGLFCEAPECTYIRLSIQP